MPLEKYQRIKELEDMVLNLQIEGVRTFVVSAGLIYGNGESSLLKFLEAAWREQPKELPIAGEGQNLVPSIHVNDLSSFILKIPELMPEKKYHFAFDNCEDRTLQKLIQSVSKSIGNSETSSFESTDLIPVSDIDLFNMNLWAFGSSLLMKHILPKEESDDGEQARQTTEEAEADGEEPVQEGDGDEEAEEENLIEFEWHAKNGFGAHGSKILEEFNRSCGHRPIKIMVKGAQQSRKSEFCELLSKCYSIPVITFDSIFQMIEAKCENILKEDFLEEKDKISELLASDSLVS